MARTVKKEWRGKSDNHMPPPTVRQRILERENGLCHICSGKVEGKGWHADHVPPLKDGGENIESKIKPAHAKCHRILTAKQAVERAPVERKKLKHSGAIRPKQAIRSRSFEKHTTKASKESLPPRILYLEKSCDA